MRLYMKQKVFSWRDRFIVKDQNQVDRYTVEGEFLSWGKKLHVYDAEGHEVAFIRQRLWSWMPRYFVEIQGREVCSVVRRFTFLKPRYDVEGLPWQVEGDFWAHEYVMRDGNTSIMRLSKKWFTWGDSYELDVTEEKDELLCLCVCLAIDAALAQDNQNTSSSSIP